MPKENPLSAEPNPTPSGIEVGVELLSAARSVQSAETVVALVADEIEAEHPDWGSDQVAEGVDAETADIFEASHMPDCTPEVCAEGCLVGIVEETKYSGPKVAHLLATENHAILETAFRTAQQGGIGDDDLAKVAAEIDKAYPTDISPHQVTADIDNYLGGLVYKPDISSHEAAERFLEKMAGDHASGALDAVASRIDREHKRPALGPNYVQKILDVSGEDQAIKLHQIESFSTDDRTGKEVLSYEAVTVLLNNIPTETLEDVIQKGVSEQLAHLAAAQSKCEMDNADNANLDAHYRAIRLIQAETGLKPMEWVKRVRSSDLDGLPQGAINYASRPEIFRIAAYEICNRNKDKLGASLGSGDLSIEKRREAQAEYMDFAKDALETLMGSDQEATKTLQMFMHGDFTTFGFDTSTDSKGRPTRALNGRGFSVINQYIENASILGSDFLVNMRQSLGLINFGSYTTDSLLAMKDIIDNPGDHPEVSVHIRGRDADRNGAMTGITRRLDFKNILAFEFGTSEGFKQIDLMLQRLGVGITSITFAGHGGESGLRLSSHFYLARDRKKLAELQTLHRLVEKITPDKNGQKNIILASCSQGRRYDRKGSMAEILSNVFQGDIQVEAPPRVARIQGGGETLRFTSNRYHETARKLEKYKKIPGVKKAIDHLMANERWRVGTVRVSKQGTTRNDSGIVSIGAKA